MKRALQIRISGRTLAILALVGASCALGACASKSSSVDSQLALPQPAATDAAKKLDDSGRLYSNILRGGSTGLDADGNKIYGPSPLKSFALKVQSIETGGVLFDATFQQDPERLKDVRFQIVVRRKDNQQWTGVYNPVSAKGQPLLLSGSAAPQALRFAYASLPAGEYDAIRIMIFEHDWVYLGDTIYAPNELAFESAAPPAL